MVAVVALLLFRIGNVICDTFQHFRVAHYNMFLVLDMFTDCKDFSPKNIARLLKPVIYYNDFEGTVPPGVFRGHH